MGPRPVSNFLRSETGHPDLFIEGTKAYAFYASEAGGLGEIAMTSWDFPVDTGGGEGTIPEPLSMIFFGRGLVAVGGFVARRRMNRSS